MRRAARRWPVVPADGRLVGIVTLDDVLRMLANELGGLAAAMQRAGRRETAERRVLAVGGRFLGGAYPPGEWALARPWTSRHKG